ncbi:ArsR/SmtB family transcription factor [Roseibium marinum]|uniref:DNA-binding transcriptional ArsR family regulator n=1 Tax=Roseibium marinum TaxID=281252 RepID=A0A2S3ULX6_9HYPH|nr:metalloregulator ArsR/SmtB family transcription factor [Roseibium marinum]POF28570.1 DNA-binding transcriptional ArsR family regulator [Roseibium marinum]
MSDTQKLTAILKAASDPIRRELLTLLVQHGPTRVTDLARHFDVSLNAVSKHIKILEAAGLVRRRTEWREHLIEADMDPVRQIDRWFQDLRSVWDRRLDVLDDVLKRETEDE